MLIVAYDFTNDKTRARFSKFLEQYGHRIQYSVFKVRNSPRVLENIVLEIDMKYSKLFDKTDSIYIFQICEGCAKKIKKYGIALHEDTDLVVFD